MTEKEGQREREGGGEEGARWKSPHRDSNGNSLDRDVSVVDSSRSDLDDIHHDAHDDEAVRGAKRNRETRKHRRLPIRYIEDFHYSGPAG